MSKKIKLDKLLSISNMSTFRKWWISKTTTLSINKTLGSSGKIKFNDCRVYRNTTNDDVLLHVDMDIEGNQKDFDKLFDLLNHATK